MNFRRFLFDNRAFLAAGMLLSFSSSYGQSFFIALFAGEIRAEFGLSHAAWGGIYMIATGVSAVAMIWAGALTDRFRVRALGVAVMGLLAGSCLVMAGARGVALLTLAVFLLRFAGQGMMSHLAVVAMARWFVARRGQALAVAALGYSLGLAFLPIVFVAALETVPWRTLWVVAAGLVLVAILPLVRLLALERTPQTIAREDPVAGVGGRHWTRGEVLRHPVFWCLVPLLLGPPAWGTALFFHQVHLAEVKPWTLAQFVALMPPFTAIVVATSFAAGRAIDWFGAISVIRWHMLPFAISFAVLGLAPNLAWAAVGLALFGVGQGMQATVISAFWAELVGSAHLGAVKAVGGSIMVFGSAIGPGITGLLIDLGLALPTQLVWLGGYFALAGIMASLGVGQIRRINASARSA